MKERVIGSLLFAVIVLVVLGTAVWGYRHQMAVEHDAEAEYESDNAELSATEVHDEIEDLDDFYSMPVTRAYEDIRNLDEGYSKEQAQKDLCFVIGAMVHNDNLYYEFMERYQNGKDAFIRVVQYSSDTGNIMIDDILYDSQYRQVILVHDTTRDDWDNRKDDAISLRKYDVTAEYSHNEHLYWILYRGELNDEAFPDENTFVITMIN